MRRLLGTIALSACAVLGTAGTAGPAQAQAPCDTYSGACVSPTSIPSVTPSVLPRKIVRGGPGTLPLTGGELTALLAAGAAAVGGGTALVVAGRRRHSRAH